jgi:hypothetical protein
MYKFSCHIFIHRQIQFARRWCSIFCFSELYSESSRFCTIAGICFPGQENERAQRRLQYSRPVSGLFMLLCYLWLMTITWYFFICPWNIFLLLLCTKFNYFTKNENCFAVLVNAKLWNLDILNKKHYKNVASLSCFILLKNLEIRYYRSQTDLS